MSNINQFTEFIHLKGNSPDIFQMKGIHKYLLEKSPNSSLNLFSVSGQRQHLKFIQPFEFISSDIGFLFIKCSNINSIT